MSVCDTRVWLIKASLCDCKRFPLVVDISNPLDIVDVSSLVYVVLGKISVDCDNINSTMSFEVIVVIVLADGVSDNTDVAEVMEGCNVELE